jgi:hypothetical protein
MDAVAATEEFEAATLSHRQTLPVYYPPNGVRCPRKLNCDSPVTAASR